jgi:hypothetical protein
MQFIKKYLNYFIYRNKQIFLAYRFDRVIRMENKAEYKKLLIENSLLKVSSGDPREIRVGLAELYMHANQADGLQINKIIKYLIKIIGTESDGYAKDAILEAICYFNHIKKEGIEAVG